MKKWMYKGNYGVLAVGEQIEALKDYFNQTRPDDLSKHKHITFAVAYSMIKTAKEAVKKVDEETEKPKRKRRTKAEIEAEKASK